MRSADREEADRGDLAERARASTIFKRWLERLGPAEKAISFERAIDAARYAASATFFRPPYRWFFPQATLK